MNCTTSLLLTAFLFAFFGANTTTAQDWLGDLLADVGSINQRVQSYVGEINEQVQKDVSKVNRRIQNDVKITNERIQNDVKQINDQVSEQVSMARKEAANAAKLGEIGPSSSIVVSGNAASSRSFRTSVDANGKPYQVESENLVVGKTLFHMDRVYNYTSKILEEHRYTLDLSDPNAKPVHSDVIRTPFNP